MGLNHFANYRDIFYVNHTRWQTNERTERLCCFIQNLLFVGGAHRNEQASTMCKITITKKDTVAIITVGFNYLNNSPEKQQQAHKHKLVFALIGA